MYTSSDTLSLAREFVRKNASIINGVGSEQVDAGFWLRMICAHNNMMLSVLVEIAYSERVNNTILDTLQEMSATLNMIDSGIAELIEKSSKR